MKKELEPGNITFEPITDFSSTYDIFRGIEGYIDNVIVPLNMRFQKLQEILGIKSPYDSNPSTRATALLEKLENYSMPKNRSNSAEDNYLQLERRIFSQIKCMGIEPALHLQTLREYHFLRSKCNPVLIQNLVRAGFAIFELQRLQTQKKPATTENTLSPTVRKYLFGLFLFSDFTDYEIYQITGITPDEISQIIEYADPATKIFPDYDAEQFHNLYPTYLDLSKRQSGRPIGKDSSFLLSVLTTQQDPIIILRTAKRRNFLSETHAQKIIEMYIEQLLSTKEKSSIKSVVAGLIHNTEYTPQKCPRILLKGLRNLIYVKKLLESS